MEQTQGAEGGHAASFGWFDAALEWISVGLEAAGVAVVVLGVVFALAVTLASLARGARGPEIYHAFRTRLARSILLGLEFLVAADIIGTVAVEPNLENLAVLGLIVIIRTFLSFSLELEIEGRWPWQRNTRSGSDPRLRQRDPAARGD